MEITYQEFLNKLYKYQDPKRSEFSKNILKTKKVVLGLTSKDIKKLAKEYKDISFKDFDISTIYEVIILYFIINIKRIGDIQEKIKFYIDNVDLIDTWGVVDTVAPYLKKASFNDATNLISYDNEYIVRLGYDLMLYYSKNNEYTDKILNSLRNDERYYIKMVEGWVLSYLYMFDFEKTYKWSFEHKELSEIILIGIQKGIDSFRISGNDKNRLRELRTYIRGKF